MKRSIKNTLMIGVIILSLVGIFLAMNYAKDNLSTNKMGNISIEFFLNIGNPPSKPDDDNGNQITSNKHQTMDNLIF